jgi:hypothetical protein
MQPFVFAKSNVDFLAASSGSPGREGIGESVMVNATRGA